MDDDAVRIPMHDRDKGGEDVLVVSPNGGADYGWQWRRCGT
jgi:hypothetical protein